MANVQGFLRNIDIIKAATHVIVFPSKNDSGTQHTPLNSHNKVQNLVVLCLLTKTKNE